MMTTASLVDRASLDRCHQRGKLPQQCFLGFWPLDESCRPNVAILQAINRLETSDEAPRHHPILPAHKDDKHRDDTQTEIVRCALDIRALLPAQSPVQTSASAAEHLKSAPGMFSMCTDVFAVVQK